MTELLVPGTLSEAVSTLAEHNGDAAAIVGGTDLVIDRRLGRSNVECLVDLSRLRDGLSGITVDGTDITIGALTRLRDIEMSGELARHSPAVVEATRLIGSWQIRNTASLSGNLCHATPSADTPPALMVHGATVDVVGPNGERSLQLADLFAGPGSNNLAAGELVTAVRLTAAAESESSCYLRQTVRWAMDLAGVGVAAFVAVDGDTVTAARVALGAVAPVPLLAEEAAAAVVGTELTEAALTEAGSLASERCSPITDARGTSEFRREVTGVLTGRALKIAYLRATGRWPAGKLAPCNGIIPEGIL